MSVLFETSLGNVVVDLYIEERPKCCLNFVKLCKIFYYNGCLFHSVQKNLVAQTGDPTGTGRGGSSIFEKLYGEQAQYFDCEKHPKIYHKKRGLVSMVNNGFDQHGSQFFFTLADDLDYLNNKHTVFGYVSEGEEFLSKINEIYCDKNGRPFRNVRIHHVFILDDPYPEPPNLNIPLRSPEFLLSFQEVMEGAPRLEEDEEIGEALDLNEEEVAELNAEKEAKTNAQLLTLLGDLPDVDAKPADNVLFVCRLNPLTKAEDLEVIFSRFGQVVSCEVIRDKRTGASLQYAFVEYARPEDCESAFFKMDNVVIDDRRIHVDFSQSVAKEWHRYRPLNPGHLKPASSARCSPPRSHSHRKRSHDTTPAPRKHHHHHKQQHQRRSLTRKPEESPSPLAPEPEPYEFLLSEGDSCSNSSRERLPIRSSKHKRRHKDKKKSKHSHR